MSSRLFGMLQQNDADTEQSSTQAQSDPQRESALDLVNELQEKTRRLDEVLDRVEKSLGEAAGESRRS